MKPACLWIGVFALACVLSGCAISDPTENTFAPQIVNNTGSTAKIDYCNRGPTCGPTMWTETLRPGQSTSDNISAGPGDLAVFVIKQRGAVRCVRLERYVTTIRLSNGTRAACHPPYG